MRRIPPTHAESLQEFAFHPPRAIRDGKKEDLEMKQETKQATEGMLKRRSVIAAFAGAVLMTSPALPAQDAAAGATVHGHVQNAAGQPLTSGQIKLTKDINLPYKDEKFTNTADIDKDGNYTVKGVAPGEYFAYVVVADKTADQQHFTIKTGDAPTVDFDMTRAEYIAKMSPEERKSLEDFKAKNAAAAAGNKQISNLNATITAVRTDIKSPTPNFDKDIADMKQATEQRPNEGLLWAVQGEVFTAQAKKTSATDRANKTNPLQDDAVKTSYASAATSLQKAADLMAAAKPPVVEQEATVYNQLGSVYGEGGKPTDATAAFEKAASLDPKGASQYYTNEAIIFDHNGGGDPEVAAAEKAIAADPNKPLPYYLKGQALLAKATVDAKGQIVPPPGCVDAYQKYLQLAPDGPQAPAVKDVLTQMGQKIESKYKAGTKK